MNFYIKIDGTLVKDKVVLTVTTKIKQLKKLKTQPEFQTGEDVDKS